MRIACARSETRRGERREVWINGDPLDPARSQKVRNHSPDGFNWGYGGSGPAQLALAILLESGHPLDIVLAHYHSFKVEFLQDVDSRGFAIEVDLDVWLLRQETMRHQVEARR